MQAGSELSVGLGATFLPINEYLKNCSNEKGNTGRKNGNVMNIGIFEAKHHEQRTSSQEGQT